MGAWCSETWVRRRHRVSSHVTKLNVRLTCVTSRQRPLPRPRERVTCGVLTPPGPVASPRSRSSPPWSPPFPAACVPGVRFTREPGDAWSGPLTPKGGRPIPRPQETCAQLFGAALSAVEENAGTPCLPWGDGSAAWDTLVPRSVAPRWRDLNRDTSTRDHFLLGTCKILLPSLTATLTKLFNFLA